MNEKETLSYMKQLNEQRLKIKSSMLESYREAGFDAHEQEEPNYLKKINVIYDSSQDEEESYRTTLAEQLGEYIEDMSSTKELINDLDSDEVKEIVINWTSIYEPIFKGMEGQVIDYKRMRLTLNKKLNERMYNERQGEKAKQDLLKEPVTSVKVDEIAIISPSKKMIGIEIHEGRNRIVRRIFESLGYDVQKLDRVMYAGLTKKNVSRGSWRYLTATEVNKIKYLD